MPRDEGVVGKLDSHDQQAEQISFRLLTEFRSWLDIHMEDKDILDIRALGGGEEMRIIVTFRDK